MANNLTLVRFKVFLIFAGIFIVLACAGGKDAARAGQGYFTRPIAGTYLADTEDGATIMQLIADGNITIVTSAQFSGGVLHEAYGNALGSWKWAGSSRIVAKLVDICFDSETGGFLGIAASTAVIKFSKDRKTAEMACKGAIFDPGVDPFNPDSTPISGSEFTCGHLEFHRIGF